MIFRPKYIDTAVVLSDTILVQPRYVTELEAVLGRTEAVSVRILVNQSDFTKSVISEWSFAVVVGIQKSI